MAFFGMDGIERQLKQAQRDLMQKDGQIAALHHTSKEKEAANSKLLAEIERLKEEKEDIMMAQQSSSNQASGSEDKIRIAFEKQLRDARDKIMSLEEQVRLAALRPESPRIRTTSGSSSSSSVSSPTARSRGGRKRASSVTTHNRISELEAEIDSMRSQASGPSHGEVDALKGQLANVKRDLNKAINEKIALEGRSRKEVEAVRSQLEDVNFELEALRGDLQSGGGVSKVEVEKMRKGWNIEKEELGRKVKEAEGSVKEKSGQVAALEERLEVAESRARSAQQATSSPTIAGVDDTAEIQALRDQITSLETELSEAKSSTTAPADFTTRKLQRQLEQIRREKKELEEALENSEEENYALKSRLPLPGSPKGARAVLAEDNGRTEKLEREIGELQSNLKVQVSEARDVRGDLAIRTEELKICKTELEECRVSLQEVKEQMETATEARNDALANLKAMRAAVLDKEQRISTLSIELKALQSEMDATKASKLALNDEMSSIRQSLKNATEAAEAKESELAGARQTLGELEATLSSRSYGDAEVEQIKQELTTLQSEAAARESAVTSAENQRASASEAEAHAKRDYLKARQEQERLMQEMADIQQREADYLESIKKTERAMSALRGELEEEKATATANKTSLEDVTAKLAAVQVDLEKARDDFEIVLKDKLDIENKLNEMQDTVADRSTESQARHRDEELFQAKEDLEITRRKLAEKVGALEKEVEMASFVRSKDVEELQEKLQSSDKRIVDLERQLEMAPKTAGRENVGMLHATIQRLRSERDELRQSLSFAQNESRFAVEAAQVDRKSAIEELEQVKLEMKQNAAAQTSLQGDIDAIRQQLQGKEADLERVTGSFAEAAQETGDHADKVSHLERQVESLQTELRAKTDDLAAHGAMFAELTHQLAISKSHTMDAEKRHRRVSGLDLAAISEAGPSVKDTGPAQAPAAAPALSRRSSGHFRTRSEVMPFVLGSGGESQVSNLTAKIAELENEINVFKSRVERRNATIERYKREQEKLKMDVELHKDSAEEFEEIIAERDTLLATVDQKTASLDVLQAELDAIRHEQSETIGKVSQLESQLVSDTKEHDNLASAMILDILLYRKRLSTVTHQWRQSHEISTSYQAKLRTTKQDSESLLSQVHTLETELIDLNTRVEEGLGREMELSRQLATLGEAEAERDAARSKVTQLEEQLDVSTGRMTSLQSEISELLEKVNLMERSKAQSTAELDVILAETKEELEAATETVRRLEGQLDDQRSKLVVAQQMSEEKGARLAELEHAVEKGKSELVQAGTENLELRSELEGRQAEIDEMTLALEGERIRILRLTSTIGEFESDQVHKSTAETELRAEISEMKVTLYLAGAKEVELQQKLAESATQIEKARGQMTSLQKLLDVTHVSSFERIGSLQSELEQTTTKLQAALTTESKLKSELEQSQAEFSVVSSMVSEYRALLDEATSGTTDRTLHLQREIDQLQKKLAESNQVEATLRSEISDLLARVESTRADVNGLTSDLAEARSQVVSGDAKVNALTVEMAKLEKDVKKASGLLKFKEGEVESKSHLATKLRGDLQKTQQDLLVANKELETQMRKSSQLAVANQKLEAALAEVKQTAGSNDDAEGLRERITELEITLSQRAQELDVAEDRTKEKFIANAKLEKKITKLQRQLKTYELAATTAANIDRTKPSFVAPAPATAAGPTVDATPPLAPITEMPPPASRAAFPQRLSSIAPSQTPVLASRAPLRQVNAFDPSAQVPLQQPTPSSLKRTREGGDEKALPAEAIMLPIAAPSPIGLVKRTPGKSFTPRRNIAANGAENVVGGTAERPVRNIFASMPNGGRTMF